MSIRFTCPNGHELNLKDKYAGLSGLCPKCQVRILVPVPAVKLTDDAIVDILGPPPARTTICRSTRTRGIVGLPLTGNRLRGRRFAVSRL